MPRIIVRRSRAGRECHQASARLRLLRLEDRLSPAAFTVSNLLDDGSGSGNSGTLRYCIGQANAMPGDDTIGFLVNGTITLAGGQLTLSDTTGQTTINGPGQNLLTIDANFASRVMRLNSSVTAMISGLTIVHGRVTNGSGGGIENWGTLEASNCTISGNSASNALYAHGGGIHSASSSALTLTNCTISANSSSGIGGAGGGIYALGGLTVLNSTITGNAASNGSGGLYTGGTNRTVSISNCTISGNSASEPDARGGGMSVRVGNSDSVTIANSTISGNTAGSTGGDGGGIRCVAAYGTLTVTNCTINGNSAGTNAAGGCTGGGISIFDIQNATISLKNCTISGNNARGSDGRGGGVYCYGSTSGPLTLTNCTISANSSAGIGGGLYNTIAHPVGPLNATNTIIAGNQAPIDGNLHGNLATSDHNLLNMSAAAAGLGPLGYYGAGTQTIALLAGSPAINAGTSKGAPPTDQRGLARVGPVDIGAYEKQVSPIVLSTVVNDGAAQRSRLSSVTVTFDSVVSFASTAANAFTLTRNADSAPVGFTATASVIGGVTVATLNNFSGVATQFGSLADGRYTLTALTSQISANGQQLDGNYDGVGGDNYVFGDAQGLYRFFGDINGDHRVDIADYGVFSLSYLNTANYVAAFDFNGDGRIDIADYGQFSLRYLRPLP